MDPLSITASVIAILTAATTVSRGLQSLYKLRHASEDVLDLVSEVSELQALLQLVHEATQTKLFLQLSQENQINVQTLLNGVKRPLDELMILVALCMSDGDKGRISTITSWQRSRKKVNTIRAQLTRSHHNVNTALGALNIAHHDQNHKLMLEIHDFILTRASDDSALPRASEVVSMPNSDAQRTYFKPMEKDSSLSMRSLDDSTFASFQVWARSEPCDRYCRCGCHARNNLQSPSWMSHFFGALFWTYTGTAALSTGSCSEEHCLRRRAPSQHLTYHFPSWMLRRAFMLTTTRGGLSGLTGTWSFGFPRAISVNHRAWRHIERQEDRELFILLQSSEVFANDLADDDGTPLLIYASKFRGHGAARLLLDHGASLDLSDPRGISARAYRQSATLTDRPRLNPVWSNPEAFDTTGPDYVNDLKFTCIHRIVTGLEDADLGRQLQLDRSSIDVPDAFGRSPLHWAVILGNASHVEALLDYGASPHMVDKEEMTPLHDIFMCPPSAQPRCVKLLLEAGSRIDPLDAWKRTPLRILVGFSTADQQAVSLLIAAGADVNCADVYGQRALLKSIQGSISSTKILLSHGANTEHEDNYGNTPILDAVYRNDDARLRLLFEQGAKVIDGFHLKPGRRARDGLIHFLDFVIWYGGVGVMKVVEEVLLSGPKPRLRWPTDELDKFKAFRQQHGRASGVEEFAAFSRILLKLEKPTDDAELFFDAQDHKTESSV